MSGLYNQSEIFFVEVGDQNEKPKLPKDFQKPIFPGLLVICFMAMLSFV